MIQFLRKKQKLVCCVLFLTFVQNVFCTPVVWALSTGPEQVEYASYESADSANSYQEPNGGISDDVSFSQFANRVEIMTSKIGRLKSVKTVNKNNSLIESTSFHYTAQPPNDQGKYTSGSLLSEFTSKSGPRDAYTLSF